MSAPERCRLYLITPPKIDPAVFPALLGAALDAGDVACVQLRLKDCGDDAIRSAIGELKPVAQQRNVAFILNDRPDLAAETRCDGVHVGQQDAPYHEARRLVGDDAIVGVSCHDSPHLAMVAADAGADYVAFGAFFPTRTKEPKARATPELLEWWSALMEVPVVAVGGITVENCHRLVAAGADFIAVSAGVWDYPEGPAAAVKAFSRTIARAV